MGTKSGRHILTSFSASTPTRCVITLVCLDEEPRRLKKDTYYVLCFRYNLLEVTNVWLLSFLYNSYHGFLQNVPHT